MTEQSSTILEILNDLYDRMVKARVALRSNLGTEVHGSEAVRLEAKATGVDLAASYVAEAIKNAGQERGDEAGYALTPSHNARRTTEDAMMAEKPNIPPPDVSHLIPPREVLRIVMAESYLAEHGSTILYDHGETVVDAILNHIEEVMSAAVDAGVVKANDPPDDIWWLD